jgi:hypothetical protein
MIDYMILAPSRRETMEEPQVGELLFTHCYGLDTCLAVPVLSAAFSSKLVKEAATCPHISLGLQLSQDRCALYSPCQLPAHANS